MKGLAVVFGLVVLLALPGAAAATCMTSAQMGGATIAIVDFAFQPATLEVAPGTTVTWTNGDATPHTVTSDVGAFDSGLLAPGASFSLVFQAPGTFAYHCDIHPMMTATLVVVGM